MLIGLPFEIVGWDLLAPPHSALFSFTGFGSARCRSPDSADATYYATQYPTKLQLQSHLHPHPHIRTSAHPHTRTPAHPHTRTRIPHQSTKEMALASGQAVTVCEDNDPEKQWWLVENAEGARGFVPSNHLRVRAPHTFPSPPVSHFHP